MWVELHYGEIRARKHTATLRASYVCCDFAGKAIFRPSQRSLPCLALSIARIAIVALGIFVVCLVAVGRAVWEVASGENLGSARFFLFFFFFLRFLASRLMQLDGQSLR